MTVAFCTFYKLMNFNRQGHIHNISHSRNIQHTITAPSAELIFLTSDPSLLYDIVYDVTHCGWRSALPCVTTPVTLVLLRRLTWIHSLTLAKSRKNIF